MGKVIPIRKGLVRDEAADRRIETRLAKGIPERSIGLRLARWTGKRLIWLLRKGIGVVANELLTALKTLGRPTRFFIRLSIVFWLVFCIFRLMSH